MFLPFLAMNTYTERTPSLTSSDSSSTTSSDPVSIEPAPTMHNDRDRPLPALPSHKSYQIPFPPPQQRFTYQIDKQRSVRSPSLVRERPPRPASSLLKSMAWQRMQRTAVHSLKRPRILTVLLQYLPWSDFYVLLSTCTDMRRLWDLRDLRDVIMAQYVPGYRYALRHRDISKWRDIDISLQDLDLLLISQRVPLHQYPVHALRSISNLAPDREYDVTTSKLTHKLAMLCLTHSRFVLLLQSLVHSSPLPLPVDHDHYFQPQRFPSLSPPLPHGLRELTFPAPLSFVSELSEKDPAGAPVSGADSAITGSRDPASRSKPRGRDFSRPRTSGDVNPPARRSRKLSIFGNKNPPPPPLSEPRSLKYYDARWRRTIAGTQSQGAVPYSSHRSFMSEDDFRKPAFRMHRRTGSSEMSSASSSISGSPSPPEFSRRRTNDLSSLSTSSPHDLPTATSRIRAPVLRVFVPCTGLVPEAVSLCEELLIENGLWEHLSTGDIVCNFGYVPSTPETDESSSSQESDKSAPRNSWLLFNGHSLVPF
ncbi:hypothetical protein AZE42_08371, partial [Rhizopogon vesiculosus]